jgi:hypothetical protein
VVSHQTASSLNELQIVDCQPVQVVKILALQHPAACTEISTIANMQFAFKA